MTFTNALIALLIASVLCLANEITNGVANWWADFRLRRSIARRGNHLPSTWSIESVNGTRERLKDARDTRAALELAALDAQLAARGQRRGVL